MNNTQAIKKRNMSNVTTALQSNNNKRHYNNKRSLSESSAEELFRNISNSMDNNDHNSKLENMCRSELVIGSHTHQHNQRNFDGKKSRKISKIIDVVLRLVIVIIFIKLETLPAFKRKLHMEEIWFYKNPRTPDIITPLELIVSVILFPFVVTLLQLMFTKDKRDFQAATWAWTLAICFTSIPTSLLKITVGRHRPDFYYRCFPDGVMVLNNASDTNGTSDLFNCTGNLSDINEGRKSFPSGHSSFAFAAFGFITFYVGAKLNAFNIRGRGQNWRLVISLTPTLIAALIAISRTCDYHHHWQDVTVGGIIGIVISYATYRQYYPSIFALDCHQSHSLKRKRALQRNGNNVPDLNDERRPLIDNSSNKQDNKWY